MIASLACIFIQAIVSRERAHLPPTGRRPAHPDEGGGLTMTMDDDQGWGNTENAAITVQRGGGEEHGPAGVAG
jgi:hypothetical protein